jgi:pimeloyl-ACP methyl ester carboxylesterase
MAAPEPVLLVHGLWMNAAALLPLSWMLLRAGYAPARFSYRSVRDPLERQAEQLMQRLLRTNGDRLHLVGHSLGGLVILETLRRNPDPRVRRVVLLGTPCAGNLAGRTFAHNPIGRRMVGESAPLWEVRPPAGVPAGVQLGVIAGERPWGLGRLFATLPRPNDGVVCAEETRIQGCADWISLRVNHSGMIFSREVARQIDAFLRNGTFDHK